LPFLLCSHEDDLENVSLQGLENFGYEHFMKGYKESMPIGHLPVTGNVSAFISDVTKNGYKGFFLVQFY
jgi:hypothetical protein